MSKRERRFLQSDVSVQSGENPKITGYCAVFGKMSQDLGNFREVIDAGAFDKCLATNPDVVGLFNHSNDMVLGRTSSGTMKLVKDATGLKYEIDPPDTSYAKDLMVSMKRGDVKSSSFGFFCLSDSWSVDKKTNENIRTILEAEIFDASVVTSPAYLDASSQVRALFPDDKGSVPEEITAKIAEIRTTKRQEKRGKNILAAVSSSKWAILPEKLETICALVNGWSEGNRASKEEIQAAMMGQDSTQYSAENIDNVAVLPIYGVIAPKATMMSELCGGFSCENFTKDFRAALADDSVTAIVFDVDSPGGTVTGVPELAAEILAARGKKPIIASVSGMAASAGYWLASAADTLIVTPSGEVGSIGVYCTHQDVSGAMDKAGVKMQFIQAGKFKTEGNPYEPLSDSARADMQKGVDEFYEMFVGGVADGRGVSVETVKADFGQGRMLMAKDALAAGMVDSIQTLDQVLAGLDSTSSVTGDSTLPSDNNSGLQAMNQNGCACLCNFCVNGDCVQCADPVCDDDECLGTHGMDDDDDLDTDEGYDTGNGAEATPTPVKADGGDAACGCICENCATGDCADCNDAQCVDPYCVAYHPIVDNKDEEAKHIERMRKLKHLVMQIQ